MKTFFTSLFSALLLSSTCSPVPFQCSRGASPSTGDTFEQSPASGAAQAPTSTPQPNSTQEKSSVKPAPAFEFGIEDGTPVSLTLACELSFPVAPMFLFMHGKDVVLAKGTPVTAYIDQSVVLDQPKFSSPPPSAPPNQL